MREGSFLAVILFADKNVKRFGIDFSFWQSRVKGGVVGPKRSENVPVAHFQRRPGGSPEPKATLTGTRQSQNGKDAQRFDVFIQEKYKLGRK